MATGFLTKIIYLIFGLEDIKSDEPQLDKEETILPPLEVDSETEKYLSELSKEKAHK